jgi:serine/threonine-protein kinase
MSTPSDRTDGATAPDGIRTPAGRNERKGERPPARRGGPESLVGVVLSGRYQIERLIGEGGMGAVYQAEHMHMRKRLAVKVLHPEMSRLPEVVARFEREAMAAAHIEHPNVAAATDFGKLDDGSFFLVLEYVEGQDLRRAIQQGRLELGRALHVARQVASALGRAHAIGIVHRDLKPENIMLVTRDGETDFVKILDFGIAKVPIGEFAGDLKEPGQALTQLGMVYGTPEYMAPEQALGQPVDARADLYSLGVILFEMLTSGRPYEHESKVTLLGMHVAAPIPRMRDRVPQANIPPALDAIVTRLLAKDRAQRFADARELIEALDACTAQLVGEGRISEPIASSAWGHPPRTSAPQLSGAEGSAASGVALGPTKLAPPLGRRAALGVASLVHATLGRALSKAPAWATPHRLAVGASVGAALLLLVIVMLAAADGSTAPIAPPEAAGPPRAAAAARPRNRDSRADERVATAQANIEKGDFATAIAALTEIEKSNSQRTDVHLLLERAYTGVRNSPEAMHEAGVLLVLDPNAAGDVKLEEDIRNAALQKEAQDEAFELLESKMGTRGVDILYDVAYGASGHMYPPAAARARRSLGVDDVRNRASAALATLLDVREAKTCEAKHALLERARDRGDARLLPVLQQYQTTRGCGFLGVADCYSCMRRDQSLSDAMSAIEQRATKGQ